MRICAGEGVIEAAARNIVGLAIAFGSSLFGTWNWGTERVLDEFGEG